MSKFRLLYVRVEAQARNEKRIFEFVELLLEEFAFKFLDTRCTSSQFYTLYIYLEALHTNKVSLDRSPLFNARLGLTYLFLYINIYHNPGQCK